MKIEVNENQQIELSEVYNEIVFKCKKESVMICERDGRLYLKKSVPIYSERQRRAFVKKHFQKKEKQ